MTLALFSFAPISSFAMTSSKSKPPQILRILSDRTQTHLTPTFALFQKSTGIEIQSLFVDKGLLARLEANPTEADVIITKDADVIEIAKRKGLLSPFSSEIISKNVPEQFRDSGNFYFSDTYRSRAIFASKDRVKAGEIKSYKDLANPKWKKRVCIRSGFDDYNLNLFAQWLLVYGEAEGKKLILDLHRNLAKSPAGNDREQVRNILEKKCDLAIANSYYMGIMLANPEQKTWAESSRVIFPDQASEGALILQSGLALTNQTPHREAATRFLEFMISKEAQDNSVATTFAYPVTQGIALPEVNTHLGEEQAEVKKGVFKIKHSSVQEIAKLREKVIQYLNEINFDKVD